MANGFKILWTDNALEELKATYEYLESNFTKKEISKLSREIDNIVYLISINPKLFIESEVKHEVRKAVILKYNTLYYRIKKNTIEILSFFSNRQNPAKAKF